MSARRMLLFTAPLVATALLLSACGSAAAPDATAKPTRTATSSASPTPSATAAAPEASPTPRPETGVPVGLTCDQLVTPQQIYDFNPNYGLVSGFLPEPGSLAGQAVAANGLACQWMNQTSGATIVVSAAHLDATSTQDRKDFLAETSTPVSSFGPDGYFDQGDLTSAAQAFPGEFWVTATSIAFFGADDAASIMGAATANVG